MCPGTITLALAAAGAAGSVVGGISSAESASYQAQVAKNNAQIARQNAIYSAQSGAAQTEQEGLKAAQQTAGVKAGIAANNLDVNTGSPLDVIQSQRELGTLDTATVANRAAEAVYGYRTQAANFTAQQQADSAEIGPDILGGLLKGAGSLGASASETGLFGGGASPSLISGEPTVPDNYAWMAPQAQGKQFGDILTHDLNGI